MDDADAGSDASPVDGAHPVDGARPVVVFDLNDVSFLYPLPASENVGDLLDMTRSGAKGPLLPKTYFDQLPGLISDGADPTGVAFTDLYASLRVVAVRVDPCFPKDPSPSPACVKQIRLVAQPVTRDPADPQGLTTGDAAVHLLYEVSDPDWSVLIQDLVALRALAGDATKGQPLDIHPVMKAQGLGGAYALALNTIVLKYAGQTTLSRVAQMTLVRVGTTWSFRAVDLQSGALQPVVIPRTTDNTQGVALGIGAVTDDYVNRELSFSPTPTGDSLSAILETDSLLSASAEQLMAAIEAGLFIERPSGTSNPRVIDCGSCHVVSRSLGYAEHVSGVSMAGWPPGFMDRRFNLQRVDGANNDPRVLRAFGYAGRLSALSQRTINESAVVAASLSGLAAP